MLEVVDGFYDLSDLISNRVECCKSTGSRVKKSGKIQVAITSVGGKQLLTE